jgi:hypothetical protein
VADLPPYEVRESRRARRARVTVTPGGKVEVVIPRGFPRERVPALLTERRAWLERALRRTGGQGGHLPERDPWPERVALPAVGESRSVVYVPAGGGAGVRETAEGLRVAADDWPAARGALDRWLHRQGRRHLPGLLHAVAAEAGHAPPRVRIGNQATRWGSCSSRGTVSLSRNLLFLPAELARYLCLHEVCHLSHPDHSDAFWRRVAAFEPAYRERERALGRGMGCVPRWALPDRLLPAAYLAGEG